MSFILKHDGTCEGDLNVHNAVILRETTETAPTETISLIAPPSVTTTYTLVFPPTVGTSNQVLSTGSTPGTLEWVTPSGSPGGSDTYIQFNNSGVFGGTSDFTWDDTGKIMSVNGIIKLKETAGDDTHYVTLKAPASISTDLTLTLPPDSGSASEFLQTDGSGNLIWAAGATTEFVNALGEQYDTKVIHSILTHSFRGIAWSPTLNMYATAPSGTSTYVFSSPDGYNWTERTGINAAWYDMIWAPAPLSKFVAVALSGTNRVMHSSDGITWSGATNAPPTSSWRAIGYSPTLGTGTGRLAVVSSSSDTYMYSDDGGDTWITSGVTLPSGMKSICIIWVPEINGGSGAFIAPGYNNDRVYKSVDGITWTEVTVASGNSFINGVAWSPTLSKLVAVGNNLSNVIYSTDEGVTWSNTGITNVTDATWNGVSWSTLESKFMAVSSTAGISIMTSSDGVTWDDHFDTGTSLYDVTESFSLRNIVACGSSSNVSILEQTIKYNGNLIGKYLKSDNDVTINKNLNMKGISIRAKDVLPFNLTLPIHAGKYGDILHTSGNGTMSWKADKMHRALQNTVNYSPVPDETSSFRGADYSPTLKIYSAVGYNGTSNIVYSYDGKTWEDALINLTGLNVTTVSWSTVKWIPSPMSAFIACAYGGGSINNDRIAYSHDGLSWTSIVDTETFFNSDVPTAWRTIVYSEDANRVIIGSTTNDKVAHIPLSGDITNGWANTTLLGDTWGGTYISELGVFLLPLNGSTNAAYSYTGTSGWNTTQISDTTSNWYDAAWSPELGILCVCGTGTNNITSSNGEDIFTASNWTSQNTGTGDMYTISWVSDLSLFIAVGTSVSTSPDGVTWTEITTTNNNWGHVYNVHNGILSVLSSSGTNRSLHIQSSVTLNGNLNTNSITLTDTGLNNNDISVVTPDLSSSSSYTLVLPVDTGTANQTLTTDGSGILSWTSSISTAGTVEGAVQYKSSGSTLSATDTFKFTPGPNTLHLSTDNSGIVSGLASPLNSDHAATKGYADAILPSESLSSYSEYTPAESNNWDGIAYGNGVYVAVSSTGTNRVMTSTDGVTWTSRTASDNNSWYDVAFGNGVFVAVSENGTNRVMTSTDGISWTSRTASDNNSWRSVNYVNNVFLATAIGGNTNKIMTSSDGITWTSRTEAEANQWRGSAYGNGVYVVVASNGTNRVMTSTNLVSWTARSVPDANPWQSVTYGNGLFVAIASTGTNKVMTSPDGITWTARYIPGTNSWYDVVYDSGVFVAVAASDAERISVSPDGITWSPFAGTYTYIINAIAYGDDKFAIVGDGGVSLFVYNEGKHLQVSRNSHTITIKTQSDLAGSHTLQLPSVLGVAGGVLTDTAGDGILNWTTPVAPSAAGVDTYIQYNDSNALGASSDFTWNDTNKELNVTGTTISTKFAQTSSDFYIASTATGIPNAQGIATFDDYLYIISPTGDKLYVYASRPYEDSAPTLVGSLTDGTNLNGAATIIHSGAHIFIGGSVDGATSGFLTSVDVSDPGLPVIISSETRSDLEGVASMVQLGGKSMTLTSVTNGILMTYDMSNPAKMIAERLTNSGHAGVYGADTSGDTLFVVGSSTITSYKITNSSIVNLSQYSALTVSGLSSASALSVQGNYAYIGSSNAVSGANGITIVDVTDPTSMSKVGSTFTAGDTIGIVTDVLASGKYLYVISEENSILHRIDITNPTSPVLAGSITGLGDPSKMVLVGNYLYITDRTAGSVIKVNISAADLPQISSGNIETSTIVVKRNGTITGNLNVGSGISTYGGISSQGPITSSDCFAVRGVLNFYGEDASTSLRISMKAPSSVTSHTLTLPANKGSAGTILTDEAGNGTLSWSELGGTKGTVTQTTSVTTGVTVNARSGKITTVPLTLATGTTGTFTVTNSSCAATNVVLANVSSYTGSGFVQCNVSNVSAGSFDIVLINASGSTLDAACEVSFAIL
jgi:hypothetical protein